MVGDPAPSRGSSGEQAAIPVKVLYFRNPIVVDIPGKQAAASVVSTSEGRAGSRWLVQYEPWLRHHRISYFAPGDIEPRRVVLVHESWCWWEPA